MSASQRTKGQAGEREVAHILSVALGCEVSRNWSEQFFGGSYDLKGVDGWAVEVKRAKREHIPEWWRQTLKQAKKGGLKPALLFRVDGCGRGLDPDEKWQAMIPLNTVVEIPDKELPVRMSLRAWIYILAKTSRYEKGEAAIPL